MTLRRYNCIGVVYRNIIVAIADVMVTADDGGGGDDEDYDGGDDDDDDNVL